MRNILDYIEKIKSENEGPRITVQEPRNMNQASLADDLEPGPLKDEMLKGFDPSQETHEEYLQRINLERPFNMVEGGRIGFATGSPGANMQEILNAYKEYKRSHHRGKRRSPIIPFRKFFEIYAEENMADGGRAGYNDGQLVTPSVDGSRPGYKGKELHYLYTPEVRQKILETRKRKFQKTDPLGKRLQWIADNGKNYDSPLEMKKAYEKYFKHKIGTKADALFYTVEGGLGVTKKLGVDNAEVLIKRIYLDQIDNLINPSKQKRGVVSFTKRFSEDELFKASIIQNNPKVRNKFIDLFADINKNAGTYAAELGPEEMVLKLKSKGGYLLDGYEKGGFDFLFSYPRPGAPEQTIGGVHRGITRNTLINAGIPVEHIKSFQLVRKPLESIEEVLRKFSKNTNYAKKVWGVGAGTSQKIASQLNNFLEGQTEARKIIRDLDTMFIKGQMNKEGYTGTVDSYLKTDAGKASRYNFTKVFGGVQFDHTLAKSIGRDYKYLPRNYLLKGQFTTGKFNRIKKDIFDLPLIEMLKKYEKGKISGTEIKNFIDDFNKKTGGYADFTFDEKKGKIVYPQEKKVTYDLSRYSNPEVVAKELEKNIRMTMSKEFQEGYKGIIPKEDLKGFKSKEAKQILAGWCSKGTQRVKDGGRIGFGGCPDSEKITNMRNAAEKLKQHKLYLMGRATTTPFASEAEAKALASKMAKSGGLLMRAGRLAMGPMTLWGEPLFEAAFVAHDILGTGTPWKEGVAKSLWAKPAIAMDLLKPADQQYEEALWQVRDEEGKALLKEDQTMAAPGAPMELRTRTGVKRFIDNNKKLDELNRLFALKQSAHISAQGRTPLSANEIAQNKAARDKNYKDYLESLGGAEGVTNIKAQIENDREAYDDRVAALEIERAQDSLSGGVISGQKADQLQRKKMKDLMYQKHGKIMKGGEWVIDPKISEFEKRAWSEAKTDINKLLKSYGDEHGYGWTPYGLGYGMEQRYTQPGIGDRKYNEELGYRQLYNILFGQPQASGGRAGYMGGGMTGIRRPSAIPPESGPQSQGLASLKKYGSYY